MMIKVGNEFLDFNDLVETEKQVKLLEDISTSDGDFSYSFSLSKTINNTRILNNPQPDNISKDVYQKIPASLLTDSGEESFKGFLRIEKITKLYECSFFAGNNNWFGMLSASLQSLDWSEYDIEQTEINIQIAIFNTKGVVFPVADNGGLLTRGFAHLKVEDMVAGIYVKDVFNKIFSAHGIKIQGELLEDVNYQSAITLKNGKSQEAIDANSAYVGKTVTQSFVAVPGVSVQITWDDDSSIPFFNGGNFNLSTESYTGQVKMLLRIELFLSCQQVVSDPVRFDTEMRVNGTAVEAQATVNPTTELFTVNFTEDILVDAGDAVDFSINKHALEADNFDILTATVKITPLFIYKFVGADIVPSWSQGKYVANILSYFNVLPHYDAANKTLTLNLFEKIKSHPAIDLSDYISEVEIDYSEFISSYGKKSLLGLVELSIDNNFKPAHFDYAKGEIEVNNDFLNDEEDILESDFTNPIGYINPVFDMSIEKTDLIELDEDIEVDVTAVTDSLGQARFAITEDEFALSDLVRVSDSTNPTYNGDWMVETLGAGFVELAGLQFNTDARAKMTKLNYVYNDTDDVFLLRHIPLYNVSKLSGLTAIRLENADLEDMSFAYFNILNTGRQVNLDFINSFSFSGVDNELHYQHTMIEQYFRLVSKILNDPVKLIAQAHIPFQLYRELDFLRPITIKTEETQNQYYLNKISGWKESYLPCQLELIKI